jgi:chromosome segregation protein
MRLKRLELLGFKSFADTTVFEFGDDTLTGIVGPNGCGKSNVVDAVRWVLGEQRPTSMRGKEMTDVIFKGCASRPGMGVAECTIVLDNAVGTIATHGAEIAVTRRVFKSGEGEYQIDGQKVRLKDVKEMLFDTGLGSRGYSVLEQGRIDAVLSANPIDRRRIFEEAAGISRYRQRKHETLLRLARVEQDLTRLDDVTGELRTRVRSLKIQAGKAERYVAAREEWETKKTRLVKHQLHRLGRELTLCLDEIAALEGALESKRGERTGCDGSIQTLEAERAEVTRALEDVGEVAARLEGDVRALAERRKQLLVRVGSWEHMALEESQRARELTAQLGQRSQELEVLEEQQRALAGEVLGARDEAERRRAERSELLRTYEDFRAAVERQNELLLEELNAKTGAENTVRHLEEARGPAAERSERVAARLAAAGLSMGEVEAAQERARVEHDVAQEELTRAERAEEAARAELEGVAGQVQALEAERNRLDLELTRRTSHIESLLDRERELADLGQGARAVLAAIEGPEGPCGAEELSGLVADHLSTGTQYARALDAVLGDRSQALVVSGDASARRVAAWLSERAEGQAALAVHGGLGASSAAAPELSTELAQRVLGRLRDHVECAAEFAPVADAVCGEVLLVRDLDAALAIVRAVPGACCVTPSGELVDAAGLVAGERTLAQGAIGRRSSAAELQAEVLGLEAERERVAGRLERARAERAALEQHLQTLEAETRGRRQDCVQALGRVETAEVRARDLRAALELLERESEGVTAEAHKLSQDLASARERVVELAGRYERERASLTEMEQRRARLEEEREELTHNESLSRVELTRVEEQIGGLAQRIADLRRGIDLSGGELQRAERLSEEAEDNARSGRAESEELAERSAGLTRQREQVAQTVAELRERAAQADHALDQQRRERDAVTRLLESRATDLSNLRLDEQRIALARDEIARRAEEELELVALSLLEGFEPEEDLATQGAVDALAAVVRELKLSIERMGPVNTEALSELEEVGGRLEFLERQIGDLAQARKVLNETLKKIEEESERLFVETFEEVRTNFQRIFRQLFGGGKADVKLTEGEPVLEAGVEISARPPGREMLPIGLLSGGQRTMTALALLFAVFEARPSPFCVLDEVDAALDDANIQRFLMMLDQFRQSTQFVVVTHNKGTMARCEGLYGVTMQTKGVSRQVSVELDEVDGFVPEANGKAAREEQVDRESGEPIKELVPAASLERVEEELPAGFKGR